MKSLDVLYYSLSIGFLILVIIISYATFRLSQLIESLKKLIDDVEETTKEIRDVKNGIISVIKHTKRFLKNK